MNKVLIIGLVIIVGLILLFVPPHRSQSNKSIPPKVSIPSPTPQPSVYEQATLKTTEIAGGKKLVEVDAYQIKITIPNSWEAGFSPSGPISIKKDGIQKDYRGVLVVESSDQSTRIGIVPNFQGGWCEGPSEPKKEILPKKFGLPVTRFDCGSIFYLYGDMNKPGPVFPNLFLSVTDDSNQEAQEVISSISYIPTE